MDWLIRRGISIKEKVKLTRGALGWRKWRMRIGGEGTVWRRKE